MKKILITILSLVITFGALAQDESAEMYNAGNKAYRAKNYQEAITNYESYIAKNELTASIAKVLGNCNYKIKNFEKAIEYYTKSIDLKYNKPRKLYLSIIACYKKLNDVDGKISALEKAYKAFPTYKKYSKMLTDHYYILAAKDYQGGGKQINDAYTKYAVKDKVRYKKELLKANVFFVKAKENLNKALTYSPKDAKCETMLKDINSKISGK